MAQMEDRAGRSIVFKTMPIDAAAEVLQLMAEHERFVGVDEITGGRINGEDICGLLKELAAELRRLSVLEDKDVAEIRESCAFSSEARKALASMTSAEERNLLKAFGLVENR